MGLLIAKLTNLYEHFNNGEPARILMLGLDAAGKTTILYKYKLNETITTIPTIGFNVDTVAPLGGGGLVFTVWDIGGQTKIRQLWHHYFRNSQGLLYIVDSTDRSRIAEAKEELYNILDDDQMRNVPLVVMANKQDLYGAMGAAEIIDEFQLKSLRDRDWFVQATCATNGDGLYESMKTMSTYVKAYRKNAQF